jgi:hypothetical protein
MTTDMTTDTYTVKVMDQGTPYGSTRYYRNGQLHRDNDLPAVIYEDGQQRWFQFGELHRDGDQPADIHPNGAKYWYQRGQLYRTGDQPSYITSGGTQYWSIGNTIHRDINHGPAIIKPDGLCSWYTNGQLDGFVASNQTNIYRVFELVIGSGFKALDTWRKFLTFVTNVIDPSEIDDIIEEMSGDDLNLKRLQKRWLMWLVNDKLTALERLKQQVHDESATIDELTAQIKSNGYQEFRKTRDRCIAIARISQTEPGRSRSDPGIANGKCVTSDLGYQIRYAVRQ